MDALINRFRSYSQATIISRWENKPISSDWFYRSWCQSNRLNYRKLLLVTGIFWIRVCEKSISVAKTYRWESSGRKTSHNLDVHSHKLRRFPKRMQHSFYAAACNNINSQNSILYSFYSAESCNASRQQAVRFAGSKLKGKLEMQSMPCSGYRLLSLATAYH